MPEEVRRHNPPRLPRIPHLCCCSRCCSHHSFPAPEPRSSPLTSGQGSHPSSPQHSLAKGPPRCSNPPPSSTGSQDEALPCKTSPKSSIFCRATEAPPYPSFPITISVFRVLNSKGHPFRWKIAQKSIYCSAGPLSSALTRISPVHDNIQKLPGERLQHILNYKHFIRLALEAALKRIQGWLIYLISG